MAAITDFAEWLEMVELGDYEDVYSLYQSIAECEQWGRFNTQVARGENNGWIVTADDVEDSLHLVSDAAKQKFLKKIEDAYCGDMNMEGWYYYCHEMEKDN